MARLAMRGKEARGSAREHYSPTAIVFSLFILFVLLLTHQLLGGQWVRFELKGDFPDIAFSYWQHQQATTGKLFFKISIQMGNKNLVFLKQTRAESPVFYARYQLEVELQGDGGRDAYKLIQDTIYTDNLGAFQELLETRLHQIDFPVEPGQYLLRITVRDVNAGKEGVYEEPVKIVGNDRRLAVSDLMLAHRVEMVDPHSGEYVFAVLPYPRAIYGILEPQLFYYFEVYSGENASRLPVSIDLSLSDPTGKRQTIRRFSRHINQPSLPVFASVNTGEMQPGKYQLELIVRNAEQNVVIQKVAYFYVYQSPIDVRYRPYSHILDEIFLIASPEEFDRLKNAAPEKRQWAILEFWRAHDPNPATIKNELMCEFYRRVFIARRFFSVGDRLTDRAKVFIKYGKPGRIFHYEIPRTRNETEIWVYPRLKFQAVFLDEFGFGEYRLVEPLSILNK